MGDGVPKPAIVRWAPKVAAEHAVSNWDRYSQLLSTGKPTDRLEVIDSIKGAPWRDRDAAANKGTLVHDLAERISLGIESPTVVPPEIKGHVESFRRFLDEWQPEWQAVESTVYSRKNSYAGTLDFIAKLPGLGLCLGDYKTSRSGIFGDIALQLSAYRYADFIGLPDNSEAPVPKVDNCVGIHITEKGYKVIPVKADEEAFSYFLAATKVARWTSDVSKTVLGSALPKPLKAEELN